MILKTLVEFASLGVFVNFKKQFFIPIKEEFFFIVY